VDEFRAGGAAGDDTGLKGELHEVEIKRSPPEGGHGMLKLYFCSECFLQYLGKI
jgi:hypothetical protein